MSAEAGASEHALPLFQIAKMCQSSRLRKENALDFVAFSGSVMYSG